MTPSLPVNAWPGSAAVKILRFSEETTATPQGERATFVRVDFNVGTHGPFTERFDKRTYDPVKVNSALNEFAAKLAQTGTW